MHMYKSYVPIHRRPACIKQEKKQIIPHHTLHTSTYVYPARLLSPYFLISLFFIISWGKSFFVGFGFLEGSIISHCTDSSQSQCQHNARDREAPGKMGLGFGALSYTYVPVLYYLSLLCFDLWRYDSYSSFIYISNIIGTS